MNYKQFVADLSRLLNQFKESAIGFIPNLIAALFIFSAGIIFARIVRVLIKGFINNFDRFIPNAKIKNKLRALIQEKSIPGIVSSIIHWILIFFFFTVATETLGLPVVTAWLSGIAVYLPKILAAVLIGFSGVICAVIVRDVVVTATASAGILYGNVLGKAAQVTIILITVLIGIEQVGIDISIITTLITLTLGALLFGASLSFGLGAKTAVSNILASYYVQKNYSVGQNISIGDVSGRIVQITTVAVILDTPKGQMLVPAKEFSETVSLRLKEEV